jgi:hypothetical protein
VKVFKMPKGDSLHRFFFVPTNISSEFLMEKDTTLEVSENTVSQERVSQDKRVFWEFM